MRGIVWLCLLACATGSPGGKDGSSPGGGDGSLFVEITTPADGSLAVEGFTTIGGRAGGPKPLSSVQVNGQSAVSRADGSWAMELYVVPGPNILQATVRDVSGATAMSSSLTIVGQDVTPPSVFATAPSLVNTDSVQIIGSATDAHGIAAVRAGGVSATSDTGFASWAMQAPLALGANRFEVVSEDLGGNVSTPAMVDVTRVDDHAGPSVLLAFPLPGMVTDADQVTVRLTVTDASPVKDVSIGGVTASKQGDAFFAPVALPSIGANAVSYEATDIFGNSTAGSVNVTRRSAFYADLTAMVSGATGAYAFDAWSGALLRFDRVDASMTGAKIARLAPENGDVSALAYTSGALYFAQAGNVHKLSLDTGVITPGVASVSGPIRAMLFENGTLYVAAGSGATTLAGIDVGVSPPSGTTYATLVGETGDGGFDAVGLGWSGGKLVVSSRQGRTSHVSVPNGVVTAGAKLAGVASMSEADDILFALLPDVAGTTLCKLSTLGYAMNCLPVPAFPTANARIVAAVGGSGATLHFPAPVGPSNAILGYPALGHTLWGSSNDTSPRYGPRVGSPASDYMGAPADIAYTGDFEVMAFLTAEPGAHRVAAIDGAGARLKLATNQPSYAPEKISAGYTQSDFFVWASPTAYRLVANNPYAYSAACVGTCPAVGTLSDVMCVRQSQGLFANNTCLMATLEGKLFTQTLGGSRALLRDEAPTPITAMARAGDDGIYLAEGVNLRHLTASGELIDLSGSTGPLVQITALASSADGKDVFGGSGSTIVRVNPLTGDRAIVTNRDRTRLGLRVSGLTTTLARPDILFASDATFSGILAIDTVTGEVAVFTH